MRKLLFTFILIALVINAFSQNLYKVHLDNTKKLSTLVETENVAVHYYNDVFCIASGDVGEKYTKQLVEKNAWGNHEDYYLVWLPLKEADGYIEKIANQFNMVYQDDQIAIVKSTTEAINQLNVAVHGGLVKIQQHPVRLPQMQQFNYDLRTADTTIENMVAAVQADSIMADIQHMEDYGTREYNSLEAIEAQDWIQAQFERYGLSTEVLYAGADGAKNVIATQLGAVYPNKYIVVGGHFDSTSYDDDAPGADDNASGTAGVIEIARILSQKLFNYTIIYCAWSAEEIGLVGSGEWAGNAADAGMDIVGYLNLDMIGYLQEGSDYHTDMMAPSSAQPLVDLYETVVDLYVDDFAVYEGTLIGGNSDHTSFNNNGYMGIFPFEDSENYSPHIHTDNDLIGPSVNNPTLAQKFTQAGVAFVATAAELFNGLYPPMELALVQNENNVDLTWSTPVDGTTNFEAYHVYRNDEIIATINNVDDTVYVDNTVQNGVTYNYYVTAAYTGENGGESNPSNTVSVTMGLMQTHFWDFEDGTQGWTIKDDNTGWRWGVPVNLSGNNTNYLSTDSDDVGSGTHVVDYAISPEIDLSIYSMAYLEFDYGWRDYSSDEFSVVYRTSPNDAWVTLEALSSTSGFTTHNIALPEAALTATAQLAFYYDDNDTWAWYNAVDNVKIIAAEQTSVLEIPQNLTGEAIEDHIHLEWTPVSDSGFVAYNIYRDDAQVHNISNIDETTYDDIQNLTDGQTYTYYISATYAGGESDPSNEVSVTYDPIGTGELQNRTVSVYPNPLPQGQNIRYTATATIESVTIYDLAGRVVATTKVNQPTGQIATAHLKPGMYLLKINTTEHHTLKKLHITAH